MMDFVLSGLAVIAGGVLLEVFAAATTPSSERRKIGLLPETDARRLVGDFQAENPS
jgi:hypothetical protein